MLAFAKPFNSKKLYSQYYKPFKIRLMCDNFTKAISDDTDFSTSLASLREWFNQENVLILYLVQLATAKAQVLYLEKATVD